MPGLWEAFGIMLSLGVICAYVAHTKEKRPIVWFLWGLSFGIFALGYLLMSLDD
ncbi:MAG: hypothetical protein GY855_08270 [candidate division Zixibacteria bacterium]|nr:hypothetical protein [candidate division Zixibacteria bacterium]